MYSKPPSCHRLSFRNISNRNISMQCGEVPMLKLAVTPAEVLSRHNIALEEKGAKFCVEITSSDKRDNISITKQPRWFYYMVKER